MLALILLHGSFVYAAALECKELAPILGTLTSHHYSVRSMTPEIESRTADRFISILDPTKTLLLVEDEQRLLEQLPQLFKTIRQGNCTLLDSAWSLLIQRSAEDLKTAQDLLGSKYAVDYNIKIHLDPDKRTFPKTKNERIERVKEMIHFQMSNYLESGLNMAQAKKQLIHRYELVNKRLTERQARGELPGLYAEAFAEALDPHSSFISADELQDFQIQMHLSLEGIGAVLRSEDGFTVIESLVPGGQADKTGQLRPKDKIVAVAQDKEDPVSTIDMDLRDVVRLIRGKKGTKVTLSVLREGKTTKSFRVTIVRDKIDVASQAAKITYETRQAADRTLNIGVIELPSFYGGDESGRSSCSDMQKLLKEAEKEKVSGIVLDLTRNGGGLLEDAVCIAGLFINEGAVVATKDSRNRLEVLNDKQKGIVYNGPLLVLVSRASASASEILAGMLRDYNRAIIAGSDHTFGKGTVQVVVPLGGDTGALKVTTAMFFLPGGHSTQRVGVSSDIKIPTRFDAFGIGEGKLQYALPTQTITPFRSPNANTAKQGYTPIHETLLAQLAANSKQRIDKDPDFAKLAEEISDIEKNRGLVSLADLRKRSKNDKDKQAQKGEGSDPESDAETKALDRIPLNEAIHILADAISIGVVTVIP